MLKLLKLSMIYLIILLIILDQLTKYFLVNTINYGAAFGILQGYQWLFILISLVVIVLCVKYYKKYKLPLSFILAGTVSNLIDRVFLGYVRDFIDLKFWPVFNLADSFNVIGVVILIWVLWKKS